MDNLLKLPEKISLRALEYVNFKIEKLTPSYNKEVDSMDIKELYKASKTPNRKDFRFINHGDMQKARGPKKQS